MSRRLVVLAIQQHALVCSEPMHAFTDSLCNSMQPATEATTPSAAAGSYPPRTHAVTTTLAQRYWRQSVEAQRQAMYSYLTSGSQNAGPQPRYRRTCSHTAS
jgi:hypothetical protein